MEDGVMARRREQRCREKKNRERVRGDGSTRQKSNLETNQTRSQINTQTASSSDASAAEVLASKSI